MAVVEIDGLRILEVGCGMGLSSLVLNHRGADITATDHHPEVHAYLDANTALNGDPLIPFVRAAWDDEDCSLGEFDLVVGADLLYHDAQIEQLAAFLGRHCRVGGEVLLVDPGRKLHARFSRRMVAGDFSHQQRRAEPEEAGDDVPSAQVLSYGRLR